MNLYITPLLIKICKFVVQTAPKCIWKLFAFAYAPCTYHHPQQHFFANLFFRLEEKGRKGNYEGSIKINDRLYYWLGKRDRLI